MAAAFDRAGFNAIDVHMSDIISGHINFDDFKGLVACGGFSYGDVLGAGEGWAKSILFNSRARDVFAAYFDREDTFSLGVCNGCQMMANIKSLIPGAQHWPHFVRNNSEQFEGRFSLVEVMPSASILMQGMAGSIMPIAVAHGEGRAEYRSLEQRQQVQSIMRYVDHNAQASEVYPLNPNGSPEGLKPVIGEAVAIGIRVKLHDGASDAMEATSEATSDAVDSMGEMADDAGDSMQAMADDAGDSADKMMDDASDSADDAMDGMKKEG